MFSSLDREALRFTHKQTLSSVLKVRAFHCCLVKDTFRVVRLKGVFKEQRNVSLLTYCEGREPRRERGDKLIPRASLPLRLSR